MPITGDLAALRRASKMLGALASPKGSTAKRVLLNPAAKAVKEVIKEQFADGIGPDGSPNRETKQGKPALESEKLARGAVTVTAEDGRIRGVAKNPKWSAKLDAHQKGHHWSKGRSRQFRNRKGRLISFKKYVRMTNRDGIAKVGGTDYTNLVKTLKSGKKRVVGTKSWINHNGRTLPPTPIYPDGVELTERWSRRIALAFADGAETYFRRIK